MPCWNREALHWRRYRSVLAQTFADFELLIVDDGSTDRTRDVALSFAEPYQLLARAHRGISATMNAGLAPPVDATWHVSTATTCGF